jgi:hypothetical protein|tara:strand:- start:167 stop:295 length:129 start_codon:yes stop_codon:yes gene_type:complete
MKDVWEATGGHKNQIMIAFVHEWDFNSRPTFAPADLSQLDAC